MSESITSPTASRPGQRFIQSAHTSWTTLGEGVRRQVLGHGADLMMVRVDFEAGAIGAVHRHAHRQVTYVATGQFEVTVNGDRQLLESGDSFYVAANLEHGVRALSAGTLLDVFTPTRQDFLGSE